MEHRFVSRKLRFRPVNMLSDFIGTFSGHRYGIYLKPPYALFSTSCSYAQDHKLSESFYVWSSLLAWHVHFLLQFSCFLLFDQRTQQH